MMCLERESIEHLKTELQIHCINFYLKQLAKLKTQSWGR